VLTGGQATRDDEGCDPRGRAAARARADNAVATLRERKRLLMADRTASEIPCARDRRITGDVDQVREQLADRDVKERGGDRAQLVRARLAVSASGH
jgi:hypothetical protein